MKLTLNRLVALVAFLAVFAMAARPAADTDTWWHLRLGQWIVSHRAVPTLDVFSHTRLGAAWLYPSAAWASDVLMYAVYAGLGYAGLNLFTAFFVTLAFVCVYFACEGHPLARAFALILAAAASAVFWSARPHIVSFALAAVFAYVLHLHRWRGLNRLGWLVPLMALWANIHGGFAIGFMLLALTLVGQALSLGWRWMLGRWTNRPVESAPGDLDGRGVLWLAGIGLACAGAVALNPSGPALLLFPFKTVSIGLLRDFIQEWQSPDFQARGAQLFLWLLFATVAALGFSRRRVNLTDLLLLCGFAYAGFLAWRNVALLAIVAPPVLTRHLAAAWEDVRARLPAGPRAAAGLSERTQAGLNWLLLGLVVVGAALKVAADGQAAVNRAHVASASPVGAAEYVRRAEPPGPMYNAYNFGGYLTWALYPDYPVFVDGRTDVYGEEFWAEYLAVAFAQPGYQAILERYGVRLAIVEANSILSDSLARDAGWLAVYRDAIAVVYRRVE